MNGDGVAIVGSTQVGDPDGLWTAGVEGGRHGHADSVPSRRRPAGPVLHGRWISTAQRTASTTLWNCSTAGRLQTRPGPTWGPSLFAGPSRAGLETVPVLADRTLPAPYPPYKMICPAAQRPPGSSSQWTPSWRGQSRANPSLKPKLPASRGKCREFHRFGAARRVNGCENEASDQ